MEQATSLNAASRTEIVRGWLQSANLSRPIRNLARDFSDGVLVAELIAHFLPRYITLSNFAHVNSTALKRYNWETLQKIVFRHLNFTLSSEQIQVLASGAEEPLLEHVLLELKLRIEDAIRSGRFRPTSRRSRSSASSRAGSTLSLNKIGENTDDQKNPRDKVVCTLARDVNDNNYSILEPLSHHTSQALGELSREQFIEKLYMRISQLERNIIHKDEKIAQMSRKIERLVDIICRHDSKEFRQKTVSPSSSPSTPSSDIYGHRLVDDAHRLRDCDSSEILDALNALDFKS